jgi:hypothetical protein
LAKKSRKKYFEHFAGCSETGNEGLIYRDSGLGEVDKSKKFNVLAPPESMLVAGKDKTPSQPRLRLIAWVEGMALDRTKSDGR